MATMTTDMRSPGFSAGHHLVVKAGHYGVELVFECHARTFSFCRAEWDCGCETYYHVSQNPHTLDWTHLTDPDPAADHVETHHSTGFGECHVVEDLHNAHHDDCYAPTDPTILDSTVASIPVEVKYDPFSESYLWAFDPNGPGL